jgi:putative iron-dependent peroxidase
MDARAGRGMMRHMETQPILTGLTLAAMFLVAVVEPGGEDQVRETLGDVAALNRSVGFRASEDALTAVVGIGSELYDRLFTGPRPADLRPFQEIRGARHVAVATPGDLLFHLRARTMGLCFELADHIARRLAGAVTFVDEVHGFRYFDERDLLGFVDGTENPTGVGATQAAIIAEQDPPFAGGSYVVVQKYVHDMSAWNALTVEEQERVIGRTKLSDIELPDDVKPPDSHVALTTIVDADGAERQIVRANMPFATITTGERGTYFIGYAASADVLEQMLTNMFVGRPAGTTDRVLDFSTAKTGALFFVPSQEFLDDLPPGPEAAAAAADEDTAGTSLAIGSLKS